MDIRADEISKIIRDSIGSYAVEVVREPGKVVVVSRLSLSVSRVSPERYEEFRRFCQAADAAFEARLVLGASRP